MQPREEKSQEAIERDDDPDNRLSGDVSQGIHIRERRSAESSGMGKATPTEPEAPLDKSDTNHDNPWTEKETKPSESSSKSTNLAPERE
ncbi:unnamed protein product [Arctogadus glacialis]